MSFFFLILPCVESKQGEHFKASHKTFSRRLEPARLVSTPTDEFGKIYKLMGEEWTIFICVIRCGDIVLWICIRF